MRSEILILKALTENKTIACLLALSIKDIGASTKVIFENGQSLIVHRSISSVLTEVAHFHSIDLKLLRKNQLSYVQNKYYIPLPIAKDLLLIPIKTKIPIVPKDPSISYINYHSIKEISNKSSIIYLNNGQKIKSLNSIETLMKRYNQATVCHKLNTINSKEDSLNLYPATKGDLERLKVDILETQRELIENLIEETKNNI